MREAPLSVNATVTIRNRVTKITDNNMRTTNRNSDLSFSEPPRKTLKSRTNNGVITFLSVDKITAVKCG